MVVLPLRQEDSNPQPQLAVVLLQVRLLLVLLLVMRVRLPPVFLLEEHLVLPLPVLLPHLPRLPAHLPQPWVDLQPLLVAVLLVLLLPLQPNPRPLLLVQVVVPCSVRLKVSPRED